MARRRFQFDDLDIEPQDDDLLLNPAIQGLRKHKVTGGRQVRLAKTKKSLKEFCLTYLPQHFTAGFCEMHDDIFEACDRLGPRPSGERIARIAPRKFGKTTIISLGLPLWKLAYQERHFILLVGESATTAESNLATIAQEIDTNEQLITDFPHLLPAYDIRGQTVKWTDRQLVFANNATAMAKGMGARMRGIKFRQLRPDLGIIDDPESPETADTFLKRRRHKRWFGGTFIGLGAKDWDLIMIGNLPHHDCLIADTVKSSEWDGKLWRAVNIPRREEEPYPVANTRTDGSALWPQEWPLDKLEAYKRQPNVGSLGFVREMMNDPREDENKHFDPSSFTYFDFTLESLKTYTIVRTHIDPAGGEKPGDVRRGKRDYYCVVTAGRTREGFIEVFDVRMGRELPDVQIDRLLDTYALYRQTKISAEENMFKNLFGTTIRDKARARALYPMISLVMNSANKISRILGTQPLIASGIVRFARHLVDTVPEFFAQYDDFPGDFDDGPDAVEGVVRQLEGGRRQQGRMISITGSSYWRKS